MWKSDIMFVDKNGESVTPEILSKNFGIPEDAIIKSENEYIISETMTEEHVNFSNSADSKSNGYNPLSLEVRKMLPFVVTIREKSDDKILGQIVSIPHSIFINKIGVVNTVISTWLLVELKNRLKRLASALILKTINTGYEKQINMGYHWISNSKTASAIKTFAWYRPLNLSSAKKFKYEIKKSTDYSIPKDENPDNLLVKSSHSDFMNINSCSQIRFMPSKKNFKAISKVIKFLSVKIGESVVGIIGYRDFNIFRPKTNKTIKAVQISYFDCKSDCTTMVLSKAFKLFINLGYIAVHGVFMSSMGNSVIDLKISMVKPMYLDFYNFAHPKFKISQIAVLYV